jgi:thiol-disulfide isomerase/thioredoxin
VRTILFRVALCAVLLGSALGLAVGSNEKEPAPRFSATTTTGEKFTNQTIKGKVALFEFWTTWCDDCANEAAFVDKIGKALATKVSFFSLSPSANPRKPSRNTSNSTRAIAKSC